MGRRLPRSQRAHVPHRRLGSTGAAVALTLLCLAAAPRGPLAPGLASAGPGGVAVEVERIEGEVVRGPLTAVDPASLRLAGHAEPVRLDDVAVIVFRHDAPPPDDAATNVRVACRGGEVLRGRVVAADDAGIDLLVPGVPRARLPFDWIRRVEADGPGRSACADPSRTHPPRDGVDVAHVRGGDAHAGTLENATLEGIVIGRGGTRRTVRWDDLVVLHLDEPERPRPSERLVEVETTNGSRLLARRAAFDGAAWALETVSGLQLQVPAPATAVARVVGGRWVDATTLPFTEVFTPYYADDLVEPAHLQAWYGARIDRTAEGCPLRIAGVAYRRGFAVHAKSELTLPLGGRFTRLLGRFGIDDEALAAPDGPKGDVTARVLGDGKVLWSSEGSVKGGEPARKVGPLDVRGVTTLVLEVDFGGGRHQMDRADWVDLRLDTAR